MGEKKAKVKRKKRKKSEHLCHIRHTGRSGAAIRYLVNRHFIETPDPRIKCGAGKSRVTDFY